MSGGVALKGLARPAPSPSPYSVPGLPRVMRTELRQAPSFRTKITTRRCSLSQAWTKVPSLATTGRDPTATDTYEASVPLGLHFIELFNGTNARLVPARHPDGKSFSSPAPPHRALLQLAPAHHAPLQLAPSRATPACTISRHPGAQATPSSHPRAATSGCTARRPLARTSARPAPFASRPLHRALLTPQANPGSRYRCGRST